MVHACQLEAQVTEIVACLCEAQRAKSLQHASSTRGKHYVIWDVGE